MTSASLSCSNGVWNTGAGRLRTRVSYDLPVDTPPADPLQSGRLAPGAISSSPPTSGSHAISDESTVKGPGSHTQIRRQSTDESTSESNQNATNQTKHESETSQRIRRP